MNKSDAIRSALKKGPLKLDQIQPKVENKLKQIFGRQKLYTLLSVMQDNGEIVSTGRGNDRTYGLKK